jgi:hypothetical protein
MLPVKSMAVCRSRDELGEAKAQLIVALAASNPG